MDERIIMITLLQEYLTINTAYPESDYQSAIKLFKKYAANDGFLVNELILPSGHPVLVITLQGTSAQPALALNHHMDVVPAPGEWQFPPFSGTVHENVIYGRGTQDCKGLGVVQYAALRQLKQSGLQPIRTIHFIMVPDEERGGFHGTKEFIDHSSFVSLNIGYVLDEGMPSGDDTKLLIKVDERTPLQIRVTSMGSQGHASGLSHYNCIHALTNFLADVVAAHTEQQQLLSSHQAGDLVSMHITSLSSNMGVLNVVPSQAQATIDIRIPSHLSLDSGIAFIDALTKKHTGIMYELLATSQERCKAVALDSVFYTTVAQSIADHGLIPKSFTFEATTDARFYSQRGIQAIGLTPFTDVPNLHGTNEAVRIDSITQGTAIISTFLHAFCMVNN